ncbi:portal protein [Alphaproteobacteria bacterium]|nr:portal protein [Alphaproteobacteria bacterium]GHS99617.1 portal protein [Alphaproteobacteria bacterium]
MSFYSTAYSFKQSFASLKKALRLSLSGTAPKANSGCAEPKAKLGLHQMSPKTEAPQAFAACQVLGRPVWTARHYEALANAGYIENVIVFRCISLIAKGLSNVPWLLYQKTAAAPSALPGVIPDTVPGAALAVPRSAQKTFYDVEVEDHPLLDLLHNPNPRQSGSSFLENVFSQYLLSGNVYIEAQYTNGAWEDAPPEAPPPLQGAPQQFLQRPPYRPPTALNLLRSDYVHILVDSQGQPLGFEYKSGKQKRLFPIDLQTGRSSLLHIKTFHPLNDWYGMSPIEAAARAIDQHNAVGEHNLSILQNGGRPSGALLIRPSTGGGTLTQEQRESLRQDIRALYGGTENAGRIMVLEGNCEWKEMGLSPKDLDFKAGKNISAREIAQAFGVPPILVGLTEEATFSNYKEARLNFWEDTLLPLLDFFVSELNRWLVPMFDATLHVRYDRDKIPALASKRDYIWSALKDATFLTVNEKRQALGYGPVVGGDLLEQGAN